jgi:Caspase domain
MFDFEGFVGRFCGIAVVAFLLPLGSWPTFAQEKRVALVIGNSEYQHTPQLTNPANDASDIAEELTKVGFSVIDRRDLDKAGMDRTLRDFAEALSGAKVGLFFYAGHGIQVGGQNYLVPVDAKLSTPAAVDFEMVRLDLVQRTMEHTTTTNIIVMDACRDNPLARNLARALGTRSTQIGRGLSAQESGEGTMISFSTQPGNVALDGDGRNSPFAEALIKHMSTPGEDISTILINVRNDVMQATGRRQVPWEHSAMTARFFFLGKGQEAKVLPPANDIRPPTITTPVVTAPKAAERAPDGIGPKHFYPPAGTTCSDIRPKCEGNCKAKGYQNCSNHCSERFRSCLQDGSFVGKYWQTHGLVKK